MFGTGGGGAFYSAVQAPSVPLLPDGIWPRGYLIIPTLVAGTALLMWMGELISQRGIGNGMSMIIFASVVAGMPSGFYAILAGNKQFWFFAMIALHRWRSSSPSCSSSSASGASPCSSPKRVVGPADVRAARTPTSR